MRTRGDSLWFRHKLRQFIKRTLAATGALG
jgi:hypothetical protein